jgi:hypothetical protein
MSIILGGIVVVIFMLLVLMFCIKRSKRERRVAATPTDGTEMRTVIERARAEKS